MRKVSYTINEAVQKIDEYEPVATMEKIVLPILRQWLVATSNYATDYEENNTTDNSPFSHYRNEFRWPLAFAYAIIAKEAVTK